jgi:23S rRNA (uracil1939-C5)-methyltransferase
VNRFLVGGLMATALANAEGDSALDLYAGVGLFSIPLAQRFKEVTAVESGSSAAADLQHNAERAGVAVRVMRANTDEYLKELESAPDFVLADPPREGLGKAAVTELVRLRPKRLHIVACDPATMARDLASLLRGGYRIEAMTLIDLFPQTYHLETVVSCVL